LKSIPICLLLFLAEVTFGQVQVLTQHNDNFRTGWNKDEKLLRQGNVKADSFGVVFTRPVDDQIYAQPLIARANIPGVGMKNVVIIATVNNSVYAFDADDGSVFEPYWQVNLTPFGWRAMKNTDTACGANNYFDFSGNIGIVGTPVIDPNSSTVYLVAKSVGGVAYQQQLHALDLATGAEKSGSPVTIAAQVPGSGTGSSAGSISFDAKLENQRSALLLSNGVVSIAWAAHGDCGNYHGWIIGYDATTLAQKFVYNATPEGYQGGIWMAGSGLSADELGNIYAAVGNGSVGRNGNPSDVINRSESALKLKVNGSSLEVATFFTPTNFSVLEQGDQDFGVTGMMLLPGRNQAISGAKDGSLYLMNRDTMGGYSSIGNLVVQSYSQGSSSAHNLSSLTYYKGTQKEFVYIWSDNVPLKAFPYNATAKKFDLTNIVTQPTDGPKGYNGAFLSVSSDNAIDSTAILWVSHAANACNANQQTCPGILRAFKANDVTTELWNSSQRSGNSPGNYAKFNCPTIANGKVYLATFSNKLMVYGLLKGITATEPVHSDVFIFPNPARDVIQVQASESIVSVRIISVESKTVFQGAIENEIRLTGIPTGIYVVEVWTKSGLTRQKLLVNR